MKKSLLALAVAAAVSPAAFAQTNVTLYGIADAGVSFDRGGSGTTGAGVNTGGSNGTAVRINSGYMSTSRFGITGTEDLGAGLKGVFTLELGYSLDTGGFSSYAGNPGSATQSAPGGGTVTAGFNRRSFVGLQGGFGTIALGRDYTPFFWAQLSTDTLGYGLYGNLLNTIDLTGSSDRFLRASNAVFYTSPKFGGLTLRAFASAGSESFGTNQAGTAPPRTANQMYGIGGEYGAGPLTIAAAYQEVRLPTINAAGTQFTGGTNKRKDWTVGAKYNFGIFSLSAGYAQVDPTNNTFVTTLANSGGFINNNRQYWVGGTIGVGKGSILAQWNRIDRVYASGPKGKADTFSLAYTYPFSRRTTAYASLGYVRNDSRSASNLWASDNNVAAGGFGADPRGVVFGVRHSF